MDNENYSMVIIDHDDTELLEQMLQRLLPQTEQHAGCEVIVVVAKGKKESDNLLERMHPQYPNLKATFVPDSARRMDTHKIAITLGVKAAANKDVAFFDPLYPTFTPFGRFANEQRHRRLVRRTGKGIDFANDEDCIRLNRDLFLERDHFDENLSFVCSCYASPAWFAKGMWLTRLKYLLAKCHLYSA